MSYLLDTCILSKGRKINAASGKLKQWFNEHPETSYFISAISVGEIQAGISKLRQEEHDKKRVFESWLLDELLPRFAHRIIGIDTHTCLLWGQLCGDAKRKGRPIPAVDAFIAASAIQHQLILVTENVQAFSATGVRLINPLA
ncbi:MAG TPA: type II toxin-antitoxin system VapC family toxin [Chlamydiales bacterium]|nr:type II toxin-antitoxin system VapC family toxin [Chlamydiales bacterium]